VLLHIVLFTVEALALNQHSLFCSPSQNRNSSPCHATIFNVACTLFLQSSSQISFVLLHLSLLHNISATCSCRFFNTSSSTTSTQCSSSLELYLFLQLLPNPTIGGMLQSLSQVNLHSINPFLNVFLLSATALFH